MVFSTKKKPLQSTLLKFCTRIKNILADFGTRYIDISEWDKPRENDQEGLHKLFYFNSEASIPSPIHSILANLSISDEDRQQLQSIDSSYSIDQTPILVNVRNKQKFYVPITACRPLFWLLHKDLQPGATIILKQLQSLSLYWPHMSLMIEQFLSQCNCTVKKNKPPHKYSEILKMFIYSHLIPSTYWQSTSTHIKTKSFSQQSAYTLNSAG